MTESNTPPEIRTVAPIDVPLPKHYRVEVQADSTGKWCGNGLTFDTIKETKDYAVDLMGRWTSVSDWRVVDVKGKEVARR